MIRKCKEVDRDFFLSHPTLKNHLPLLDKIKKSYQPNDDLYFIKAPGRINLIGEHTDYNMGPVLPCAIDKEVVFCLRENETDEIKISNVDTKFENFSFSIHRYIEPFSQGYWGNYVKAGTKGIIDFLTAEDNPKTEGLKGYDAIVSSTLPVAAGVSSSSALVVAAAFAFVQRNNIEIEKLVLAKKCAKAEQFVGVAGGGMDQAVSIMGKKDSFLKIDFNPLKVNLIPAPEDLQLVLFHSLIKAEKSGAARMEYNRRVLECRIGVDYFNQFIKENSDQKFQTIHFIGEINSNNFDWTKEELDKIVVLFLEQLPEAVSTKEILSVLKLTKKDLEISYKNILKADPLKEPADGFKLKKRFRHVYTECQRVDKMIEALLRNDKKELGDLINASHKSLANDYEVSTPEVDKLVDLLKANGALGARIMGAGFGGMVLAIADPKNKARLIEKMENTFYQNEMIENCILSCTIADGLACL